MVSFLTNNVLGILMCKGVNIFEVFSLGIGTISLLWTFTASFLRFHYKWSHTDMLILEPENLQQNAVTAGLVNNPRGCLCERLDVCHGFNMSPM